ncbi:MAG: efflux RND transporter periplasmic adaptor subunit, partial [Opitutaceae bacterium]
MKPSALLSGLVALVAAGCSRPEAPHAAMTLPTAKVRVTAVQASELPQLSEVTGTVRPVQRATLSARTMGAIIDLPVALGQRVRAGETLARIAAEDTAARVAQAKSQLNLVKRDLARERDLLTKGASTAETVRTLEDRLAGLEAAVREAEALLAHAEIRAPFDGVIARRPANPGDIVFPGQALLEIEGASGFEIEAGIPETLASTLRTGTTLGCRVDGLRFNGVVRELSPAADPATRTVSAKIAVPAGTAVRSGQFARLEVAAAIQRTLLVPAESVSLLGQMERVFLAGEQRDGFGRYQQCSLRGGRDFEARKLPGTRRGARRYRDLRTDRAGGGIGGRRQFADDAVEAKSVNAAAQGGSGAQGGR